MAHTPGPWRIGERRDPYSGSPVYSILAGDHLWLADVLSAQMAEGEANARLIAAAPELLEACQAALGFCVNARQTWDDWEDHQDIGILFAKVRVAIDAAKGEKT